jgi:hypothetical protein
MYILYVLFIIDISYVGSFFLKLVRSFKNAYRICKKLAFFKKSAVLPEMFMKNKICFNKICLLNLDAQFYFSALLSKSCDYARIT